MAVDIAAAVGIYALLFVYFPPALLLSTTTTTGGDTGAHIYAPWYLRNVLLEKGMLSGWSPDWYAGFPILHFYFPLVATFQAAASFLIPYEVAFKLGTVLGTFSLPLAVYAMFRLLRFPFPTPALGAIASIGFLFMDSYTIYGGNIASSLAGEYSFSLSMALCCVFLGLAYRAFVEEDWGRPVLPSVVLAGAVLSHLVPVIMALVAVPLLVYWGAQERGPAAAGRRFSWVFGLAFALTAFWSIPFLARLAYTADMSWIPTEGWGNLFPRELWLFVALGVAGALLALLRIDKRPLIFLLPAVAGVAIYFFLPQGHVWNGRFLPFWYLGMFLSAAYALGTTIPTISRGLWRRRSDIVAVGLTAAVAIGALGWNIWDKKNTFIDYWVEYNYGGYEAKDAYPEFSKLVDAVGKLPPGRVMWEPSPDLGRFGTPVALMSLPYWAGQETMEGIYFESSYTTPFHFLTAAEVAEHPSNPIPGLPYTGFNLERGVEHMKLMDVAYYVAFSQKARSAAEKSSGLKLEERVGDFSIFSLRSPGRVVVPRFEPAVLEEADWIDANVDWFGSMRDLDVPLVREGLPEWDRVSSIAEIPRNPIESAGDNPEVVTRTGDDYLEFSTTAVGVPHWVKVSYFPNWRVEGAEGPFLASPSMMVVVPTGNEVRLEYGRTWAEWLGILLTLGGIGLIIVPVLVRTIRRRYIR